MSYSRNRNRRERARKARADVIDVNRMARRVKRAAWRSWWMPRLNVEIGKADRRTARP